MPIRTIILRRLLTRFPIGSFESRLRACGFERPWYAWCLFSAAVEAKALGHHAMTAIELGVAGGSGLLTLCNYRDQVAREIGLEIVIQGLDAGTGLPKSSDSRDLLYLWPSGSFEMNIPKLQERIKGRAEICLGDVGQTTQTMKIRPDAPVGAIMFDLDYYSSTLGAFAIFSRTELLPRVWCYFDDISGDSAHAYTDRIGVRAAIGEFNAGRGPLENHVSQAYAFKDQAEEEWHKRIYAYHNMKHPDYNRCLSDHKHVLELV